MNDVLCHAIAVAMCCHYHMNKRIVVNKTTKSPQEVKKEKKSFLPNFLRGRRKLSVHKSIGKDSEEEKGELEEEIMVREKSLAREEADLVIDPTKYDDDDDDDDRELENRPSEERPTLFGSWRKKSDKTSLRRNSMAPIMLEVSPAGANDEALLTTIDQRTIAGTSSIAELRRGSAYAVALKANEDALLASASILGEDHPDVIHRKQCTANIYKGLGNNPLRILICTNDSQGMHREAAAILQDILDQQKKKAPDTSPSPIPSTINDLALVYSAMER
jgi:hypothetical protein